MLLYKAFLRVGLNIKHPVVRLLALGPRALVTNPSLDIGHSYYYNVATKQSTYTRPTLPLQALANPLFASFGGPPSQQYSEYSADQSSSTNSIPPNYGPFSNQQLGQNGYGGRSGGRGGLFSPRARHRDTPKKKYPIPGCEPWYLVKTKLGRRFVFNPDKGESYWKFPPEVMKAVVDFDRAESEKRKNREQGQSSDVEYSGQAATREEPTAVKAAIPTVSPAPGPAAPEASPRLVDSDGEEYEEVEVTDNEDEEHPSKRQKTEEGDAEQPVEFNEDDIAYQLAAMGEDYGLDRGEYGNLEDEELEEGAGGLILTKDDTKALFKDMLNDFQISPYTPWEKVIEARHIIEDDRYIVLPNMKARKEVWDEWSRDRIQQIHAQRETEEKRDPRIPYFAFLESHATPKLYWPEFRRKYRSEPEMRAAKVTDKDREKWYREYINRLKLPESTLKADLVKLLKSTPLHAINRSTTLDTLPPDMLTDMRYISLRKSIRTPLIEAHVATLPPASTDLDISIEEEEAQAKEKQERERREKALAERQKQVEDEKRRQQGALKQSKGMLREEEDEIQKAMRIGKEGLLGYMDVD